jgi:1,2-diacylglycerol 3-alpha-glucosyltransferase
MINLGYVALGLGWFPPAAHFVYLLLRLAFYGRFADIHCPSTFIAAQLRRHGYRARLHVISNGVGSSLSAGTGPGTGRR